MPVYIHIYRAIYVIVNTMKIVARARTWEWSGSVGELVFLVARAAPSRPRAGARAADRPSGGAARGMRRTGYTCTRATTARAPEFSGPRAQCIYTYFICIYKYKFVLLHVYIRIFYVLSHASICIYMYIYIYIERERERDFQCFLTYVYAFLHASVCNSGLIKHQMV